MTRTLSSRHGPGTGKPFHRCPACGKRGVYVVSNHDRPLTVAIRCRYCRRSLYLRERDYYSLDATLKAFARTYQQEPVT